MDGPIALPTCLDEACDRLVARFRPLRVILFGSWATGTAQPDSDVDLLVVMPGPVDRRGAAIDMRRALRDLPISKDIIVATPEDIARRDHLVGTLLSSALRDGRTLFERI